MKPNIIAWFLLFFIAGITVAMLIGGGLNIDNSAAICFYGSIICTILIVDRVKEADAKTNDEN